jgi:hypothetical protein
MFVYLEMLGKGTVQEGKKILVACCVLVAPRSQSAGMLCHVDWCGGTDVLDKHAAPQLSVSWQSVQRDIPANLDILTQF